MIYSWFAFVCSKCHTVSSHERKKKKMGLLSNGGLVVKLLFCLFMFLFTLFSSGFFLVDLMIYVSYMYARLCVAPR